MFRIDDFFNKLLELYLFDVKFLLRFSQFLLISLLFVNLPIYCVYTRSFLFLIFLTQATSLHPFTEIPVLID